MWCQDRPAVRFDDATAHDKLEHGHGHEQNNAMIQPDFGGPGVLARRASLIVTIRGDRAAYDFMPVRSGVDVAAADRARVPRARFGAHAGSHARALADAAAGNAIVDLAVYRACHAATLDAWRADVIALGDRNGEA